MPRVRPYNPYKPDPERPEETSISVPFRYVSTKHSNAATYKGYVVITMPSEREWMTPNDAEKHALAILEAVKRQRDIDRWERKYRPDSYEGKQAKKRHYSHVRLGHVRSLRAALKRLGVIR